VRTAETFVIEPKTWKILYHGPLNDRLTYGKERAQASNNFVSSVLDAKLAGKEVPMIHQMADGCIIDFPNRANVKWDLNLPRNPKASSLGFSFGNVLDSFTLDITIDALEAEGYARRLSAPKVATLNNETAEIEQGLRYPIVTTTATEVDVQFIAASLLLRVTPQITAEGTIALDLDVENNSPDFVVQVAGIPSINTQRAATKILIKDGGTAVIGGIFSVNEGNDEIGVPWLRKLPALGWLFKSRGITSKNRELLIFVTGKIIKAY
jgi:type IV pilus assembly protein PilQ